MKKQIKNNRGFSLVELLIAVAVMAILITPIVSQLVQTINTSGQAKERQYVIDNVENVVEQFRSSNVNTLDNVGDTLSDPYLGTVELMYDSSKDASLVYTEPNKQQYNGKLPCKLVDKDGNAIDCYRIENNTEVKDNTVYYTQRVYSISNPSDSTGYYLIGKKKTKYTATIVQNDLNNAIAECYFKSSDIKSGSLEIDFGNSDSNSTIVQKLKNKGFERRSDNMIIKYSTTTVQDSNNKDIDIEKINSVVCKKNDSYIDVENPNNQKLANLQNIDSKTMAIIESDATTFDYDIERDISLTLTHYAKANPNTTLGKKAKNAKELNAYIKDLITNPYSIEKSRAIHLSITAGDINAGSGKPDFYHVRCDVVYRINFPGSGSDIIKPFGENYTKSTGTYTYNVLNRDYYTKDPTNVYFVYEPLLLSTKSGNGNRTYYADNDYIYITTDKYTNNVIDSTTKLPSGKSTEGLKSPTIYLIGSTKNWAKQTNTETNTYIYEGYDYHMYRTYFGNAPRDVNIVIANAKTSTNTESTGTFVYTNIAVATYTDGTFPESSKRRNRLSQQFKVDSAYVDKPEISGVTLDPKYDTSPNTLKVGDDYSYIKPFYLEQTDSEGRLYQTTAIFKNNESNEKIYLSGAKGAN